MPSSSTARTTAAPFTLKGTGLHGNKPCSVTVEPAQSGGLRFLHAPSGVEIPALARHAECDLTLATVLSKDGARLQTVEHLLSALYGMGVDHALIISDGGEFPILDGSAGPWAKAIARVGLRDLAAPKRCINVLKEVRITRASRHIAVGPCDGFAISYTIDFPCRSIGRQSLELAVTPEGFLRELADARTFCMKRDIDMMQSRGLALGGSLENAVVFDDDRCLNEPLRFLNEAVRHKALDLVGDLALLGAPLKGRIEAFAAGHAMHVDLAKKLLATPDAWTMEAPQAPEKIVQGAYRPDSRTA